MRKNNGYKISIAILSIIIFCQWIFIARMIPPKKALKIPPVLAKAKIAIVIDDWGYNLNTLPIVDQIKYPLTLAVLPNLNYSRQVSEELHSRGFEIILHLPMEPHEKYRLERNTILTSFDEAQIKNIIGQDLASLNYARGVSNHMGSRVTEDAAIMEIILKELKKRDLFFLDSFVSPKSICSSVSGKLGLGFAKRDVFLDNIEKPEYIKGQIRKLTAVARKNGHAVGIGHDQRVTLEVLKEAMPALEKEGYKFVFVSELVK